MYEKELFLEEIEEAGGNFDILEEPEEWLFDLDEAERQMELNWLRELAMEFGGYRYIPLPGEDLDDILLPEAILGFAYMR